MAVSDEAKFNNYAYPHWKEATSGILQNSPSFMYF